MKNDMTMIMKEKVNYYFELEMMVHLVLQNKTFYNGYITEKTDFHFIIDDRMRGKQMVTYSELIKIERFTKR